MAMLLVVTNCGEIPSINQKTGWYLPEVAHPHKVFQDAGISMTIVSPLGGKAPVVCILSLQHFVSLMDALYIINQYCMI